MLKTLAIIASTFAVSIASTEAAVSVTPRGHDKSLVWAGSYSFQFKVRSTEAATKVFFYGFRLPDGSISFTGYEVSPDTGYLTVTCYSKYHHNKTATTLENVWTTGNSSFKRNHRTLLIGIDNTTYALEKDKVYTVRVNAKDKMHTVNLFLNDKKVASATYDASMLYAGDAPKKFQVVLNKPFAVKDAKDCPVLPERPKKK